MYSHHSNCYNFNSNIGNKYAGYNLILWIILSIGNLHQFHPPSSTCFDADGCFGAVKLFGHQTNQFCIGFAINGYGFDLSLPCTIFVQHQGTDSGIGFDFDLNDV